jgi:hypothetical protein
MSGPIDYYNLSGELRQQLESERAALLKAKRENSRLSADHNAQEAAAEKKLEVLGITTGPHSRH